MEMVSALSKTLDAVNLSGIHEGGQEIARFPAITNDLDTVECWNLGHHHPLLNSDQSTAWGSLGGAQHLSLTILIACTNIDSQRTLAAVQTGRGIKSLSCGLEVALMGNEVCMVRSVLSLAIDRTG
eukprot:1050030-Amphidinium_carterae.1